MKKKIKMIRIRHVYSPVKTPTFEEKWVKKTNPYFEWYKQSRAWEVIEEREIEVEES